MSTHRYNVKAFARNAVLHMVDLDINEAKKPKLKVDKFIKSDAKKFIEKLNNQLKKHKFKENFSSWIEYCNTIKKLQLLQV